MKTIYKITILLGLSVLVTSCHDNLKPNYQYMPNMYESVGYETYSESDAFKQVDQQLALWQKSGKLTDLQTNSWSIHHWLHFIGQLAATVDIAQLQQLDQGFGLSQSQNAEVATAWFKVALAKNYTEAQPALEKFLVKVGRRKFVVPLYQQLSQSPQTLSWAKVVYQKARSGYHPLTQSAVDKVLKLH